MSKSLRIAVAFVLVAGACSVVLADPPTATHRPPAAGLGELYDRTQWLAVTELEPVALPSPGDDNPVPLAASVTARGEFALGPVAIDKVGGLGSTGSVLTNGGGGSMMTPRQRAERTIRSVIKNLG